MTDKELDELARLCNEASPGPWHHGSRGGVFDSMGSRVTQYHVKENAEFIIAARTALPKLIALVRECPYHPIRTYKEELSLQKQELATKNAEIERLKTGLEQQADLVVFASNQVDELTEKLARRDIIIANSEESLRASRRAHGMMCDEKNAEIEQLRELLKEAEWADAQGCVGLVCPVCDGLDKHDKECDLAKALEAEEDSELE